MLKKILCVGLLIAAMATTAFAQEDSREANPINRIPHPIGSVEIVQDGDNFTLVITGDLPDGCTAEPVINAEPIGVAWFIDIYRELPFDVECTQVITPYEVSLEANFLFPEDADAQKVSVIVINGTLFGVEYATEDVRVAPLLSTNYVRGVLPYDSIQTNHLPEGAMEITLSGTLSDSCPIPVYRAYEDWQNPGFVVVEAYTAINIAAMCAQAETPFEVVMRAPLFETFAINGVSVPFNPAISVNIQRFLKQPLAVESVATEWVEGLLPNLKVTVTGTVDGCEFPIQVVPGLPVDNTYQIEVVRVVPEDTVCPMIAREFTEEIYLSPDLSLDMPVVLYIGDQTYTVETE